MCPKYPSNPSEMQDAAWDSTSSQLGHSNYFNGTIQNSNIAYCKSLSYYFGKQANLRLVQSGYCYTLMDL